MEDETRSSFDYFSSEYAQALQAIEAIELQSSTLIVMGCAGDLRTFVEQFIDMATRVRELAVEKNEANFAEWFGELIARAERLRVTSDP